VRGVTEAKKEVVWWGYDEVKLEVEEHRDGDGDGMQSTWSASQSFAEAVPARVGRDAATSGSD
jgi:hypothetical protein